MSADKKFGLLRNMLRAIGLSQDAADQVVDFIVDLLAGEGKGAGETLPVALVTKATYPAAAESGLTLLDHWQRSKPASMPLG